MLEDARCPLSAWTSWAEGPLLGKKVLQLGSNKIAAKRKSDGLALGVFKDMNIVRLIVSKFQANFTEI
jgi:hypothetical protein